MKINWPVSTSTLSGVPSILSTICEFKVCYQSCSLKRASFTLKAILIRVERVSTIRLRSGTVLVNLKYFDVIVLLLCITYIYQTHDISHILYIDSYHSSAISPNGPRSRSPPVRSIVTMDGRDSTNTWKWKHLLLEKKEHQTRLMEFTLDYEKPCQSSSRSLKTLREYKHII